MSDIPGTTAPTAVCPPDDVLAEYAEGLLAPSRVAALEAHVDACPTCRGVLSALGRSTHLARLARGRLLAAGPGEVATGTDAGAARPLGPPGLGLREGELVADRYRVERLLGEGGMGVVVAARHVALDQPVAVKLLRPELAIDASTVQRFIREARAASRLKTPHVARVLDLGTTGGGLPFLVMELLEGKNLREELAARGRLPEAEAAALMVQVCDALAEAHAAGIVHRDLKPENLFLVPDPERGVQVKVLDFGVSKFLDEAVVGERIASTATQAVIGSPQYMAPEQLLSSKQVDARTDLWALGVILYQLVSGKLPFDGPTMPALSASILRDAPRAFDATVAYRTLVTRCLAKDPDGRPATISILRDELRALGPVPTLLGTPGTTAPTPTPTPPIGFLTGVPAAPSTKLTTALTHRQPWPYLLLALALCAATALITWLALRPSAPAPAPAPASASVPSLPAPAPPAPAPVLSSPPPPPDATPAPDASPPRRFKKRSERELLDPT